MPKFRFTWSETHSVDIEGADEAEADEKWEKDFLIKQDSRTRTGWERYEPEIISE